VTIRTGADIDLTFLRVGVGGTGSVVQSGGSLELMKSLILGEEEGGLGSYTIRGGTIASARVPHGIVVGDEGTGHLMVIGDGAGMSIDIAGHYRQNGTSMLTFEITDENSGIEPMTFGKTATFESGAKVQIRYSMDFRPGTESFDLLIADEGITDDDIDFLAPGSQGEWCLTVAAGAGTRGILRADHEAKRNACP
jgi:hypothetical protein